METNPRKSLTRPTGRVIFLSMEETGKQISKRDQLVEIASTLFYQQGFGATGIKQIIEAAGIAKGTFYSHFSSKEEIGIAWLQKRHQDWMQWLHASMEKSASPKGKLLRLFDFLESWMTESEFRGCAFLNTLSELPAPDNPMRHEIESHKQSLFDTISSLVGKHYKSQGTALVSQKAKVIFLLFEGALVEAQNFRDVWPIIAASKEVKTILSGRS